MKTSSRLVIGSIVLAAMTIGMTAMEASAAVKVTTTLSGTSVAPGASGQSKLVLKTAAKAKFGLTARKLPANGRFDVVVRGRKVGTMLTNAAGTGRLKLSTPATPRQAILGFDPRGAQIVVRDTTGGDDDLVGAVPDDGDSAAGACCFTSAAGEAECDDLTAADCASRNGTPANTASCLPNPCVAGPPTGVVCCTGGSESDEEVAAECKTESTTDCADEGGSVVNAPSCDANPCAATPPPATVVCCVPDGSKTECEKLTDATCTARNGAVSTTAPSCDADPCGTGSGGGDGSGTEAGSGGGDGTGSGTGSGGGDGTGGGSGSEGH